MTCFASVPCTGTIAISLAVFVHCAPTVVFASNWIVTRIDELAFVERNFTAVETSVVDDDSGVDVFEIEQQVLDAAHDSVPKLRRVRESGVQRSDDHILVKQQFAIED